VKYEEVYLKEYGGGGRDFRLLRLLQRHASASGACLVYCPINNWTVRRVAFSRGFAFQAVFPRRAPVHLFRGHYTSRQFQATAYRPVVVLASGMTENNVSLQCAVCLSVNLGTNSAMTPTRPQSRCILPLLPADGIIRFRMEGTEDRFLVEVSVILRIRGKSMPAPTGKSTGRRRRTIGVWWCLRGR
jgi:hypothetical protein